MGGKGSALRDELRYRPPPIPAPEPLPVIQPVSKLVADVPDIVRLLWLRHSTELYGKLSMNIVREIWVYLSLQPFLIACAQKMYRFNCTTKEFDHFFDLDCFTGPGNVQNSTFIGENAVFMTLRDVFPSRDLTPFFAIYCDGVLSRLSSSTERLHCSITYSLQTDTVYIFGGESSVPGRYYISKSSEKYQCSQSSFATMRDMKVRRSMFTCCWHRQVVYLCGGTQCSVEVFYPKSEKFALVGKLEFDPETEMNFVTASYGSGLVILSSNFLWKGPETSLQKQARRGKLIYGWVCRSHNPIVVRGVMYVAENDGCLTVNVATGEEAAAGTSS